MLQVALMFQKLVLQDRILEVIDMSEKQESKGRPPGLNTVNLLKVRAMWYNFGDLVQLIHLQLCIRYL